MASQINPSMTYYQPNPAAAKKRKIGAMMAGALIGTVSYTHLRAHETSAQKRLRKNVLNLIKKLMTKPQLKT